MKKQPSHSLLLRVIAAAIASSAMPGDSVAEPGVPPDVTVVVYATYYALAGRAFDDLDKLTAAIDSMSPRSIGVDACGPGTTRALMAAAYRLHDRPLHLRLHDRDDVACARQAMVTLHVGQRGLRFDDEVVDRYWRRISP